MIKKTTDECAICRSKGLEEVLLLPKFPFTGIYVKTSDVPRFKGVDQGFLLCQNCGHGQLKSILDPELVYDETYTHRSSASPIATTGNDFFAQFLRRITEGRRFRRVLDVGCNDLYLLGKIRDLVDTRVGIDPIWRDQESKAPDPTVRVLGKFIEEIDLPGELGGAPDLVVSAHAFEHVESPRDQLQRLVDCASQDALFLVEVPGFDSLLANYRFDQIFHQHIHHYSLASFERLIQELGCEYVAHSFNYRYWGGTMLVAFQKATKPRSAVRFEKPTTDAFAKRLASFRQQMQQCMQVVDGLRGEAIYGFGAAQMLPTVAYHLGSDLGFMRAVLDDNPTRDGLMYPYLPVKIVRPSEGMTLEDANVLVMALDSMRPILKRVTAMNARRILLPLHVI